MAQNPVLSRLALSLSTGFLPAALVSAALALLPLQLISEAQEPSELRAIPAETTAAKAKDPNRPSAGPGVRWQETGIRSTRSG
jgi:hypothetical protein